MSALKATPGPWWTRRYVGNDESYFVRGPNNERICGQGAGPVHEANAHLIAAGPDLYEACRYIVEAGENGDEMTAIEKAKAALAKARGEA